MKKVIPIIIATLWISFSEFIRNNVLLKRFWTDHYESLGIVFPEKAINGALWGLWSLLFAIAIYFVATKFTLIQTVMISWLFAFVMMWVVIGNLGVLPIAILWFAVPLSLLETFVATWIIKSFQNRSNN
jgi:hypothetical protein